jgi:hypothetical protein
VGVCDCDERKKAKGLGTKDLKHKSFIVSNHSRS